jgi:hypothetical protein
MTNRPRTYLNLGSYNVICDRCGEKFKAHQVSKEWTGLLVCGRCLDERHPQDFVRGRVDQMSVPVARPLPTLQFQITPPSGITGYLIAPLYAGPEAVWDYSNVVYVHLNTGTLASAQGSDVLNGANVIAVESTTGVWEILQFQDAVSLGNNEYALSKLLRAHIGTELNMGNPSPEGARFLYIGQSNASAYIYIHNDLGIGELPFSPIDISAYLDYTDLVISWVRRTKTPRIDQDDYDPLIGDPLGELYEEYEIDILTPTGDVVRTIYNIDDTKTTYGYFDQVADFGSVQPSYTIRVYQISPEWGRGSYRQATITLSSLQTFYSLYSEDGSRLIDESSTPLYGI